MTVKEPIAEFASRSFRDASARPRVVRAYAVQTGWVEIRRGPELTDRVLRELKQAGYSMIEARWRRRTKDISLVQVPAR
jgi:hypothetical protein